MARQVSVYTSLLPISLMSAIHVSVTITKTHHDTLWRARQVSEVKLLSCLYRCGFKKASLEIRGRVRSLNSGKFSRGETKHSGQ